MPLTRRIYEFIVMLVVIIAVSLDAVTVNPSLCPTNKIAPHRRIANWDYSRPRTFGAFYDLLAHNNRPNLPNDAPSDLQEKPQEDDPDDCGEIEDYDENDVNSATSQSERRQGSRDNRFFTGNFFRPPQYAPVRPPPPIRPPRPSLPPTRPLYWSGGIFGDNDYRPPLQQFPSGNIKPVHENNPEDQATYRPNVVGGSLGHVVGVSPARPPRYPRPETTSIRASNYLSNNFPPSTQATSYPNRRARLRTINNNSVFGSFFDLLFK